MSSVAARTPLVTRGESLSGAVLVDTLSLTLPLTELERVVGASVSTAVPAVRLVPRIQAFLDYLFGSGLFACTSEVKPGRNFFDASITFGDGGFVAFGGNNAVVDYDGAVQRTVPERLQLYLPGEACVRVADWQRVFAALLPLDCRLTRVDLAFDDFDGVHTLDEARAAFVSGDFVTRGRPPTGRMIDDLGSGEGRTLYVGKRQNGKMARIYEKGKSLGDPASPWVRWELELHSRDRDIPLDVLIMPQLYLAGAYPAFAFISDAILVVKTSRLKLSIQYSKLKSIARKQYGRLVHFMHRELGLDFYTIGQELLVSDGYPSRLQWSRDLVAT